MSIFENGRKGTTKFIKFIKFVKRESTEMWKFL